MEKNSVTFERVEDKQRRNKYLANQIKIGLRFQLKALRKDRNLTQAEFAELTQTKQSVISRVENRGADKLSIPTLLKFAEALDVGLVVRFEPIDTVADWYDNLTPSKLAPKKSEDILKEIKKKPEKNTNVSEVTSTRFTNPIRVSTRSRNAKLLPEQPELIRFGLVDVSLSNTASETKSKNIKVDSTDLASGYRTLDKAA